MIPKLITHQWKHPYKGNVTEVLCPEHDQEVLAALRVLSIGSGAREARPEEGGCTRCNSTSRRSVDIGAQRKIDVP